jgi:hypothetical protein
LRPGSVEEEVFMRIVLSRPYWLLLLASWLAVPASAQTLSLDEFDTGPYLVRRASGITTAYQSGAMIGGYRQTTLNVASNPFGQTGSLMLGRGGLLVVNADAGVYDRAELYYGQSSAGPAPLGLDLTPYDRFRVHFESNAQSLNFNIVVFTSGKAGYDQLGYNVSPRYTPFCQDFPFSDFVAGGAGADWSDVDAIWLVFQTWPLGGGDFAVDSLETVAATPCPTP